MADDLDDRLRAAMKTLDAEAPSGYFEALPEQLLARLSTGEEVNMQQTGIPDREASSSSTTSAPPVQAEENSGLHDIRNLAQSTKQRISSKRITGQNTTVKDDDVLASSSASWKNLALPQPANMVSLPALDELPSKKELAKAQKDAARAAKHEAKAVTPADVADASSSGALEFKPAFSAFNAPAAKKSHKGRTLALVGMGLAAAAGVTLFVMSQNKDHAQPTVAQPAAAPAGAATTIAADKVKQLDEATAKLEAEHQARLAAEAAPVGGAAEGSAATGAGDQVAAAPVEAPATKAAVAPAKVATKKPVASRAGKGKLETTEKPAPVEQKADTSKTKGAGGGTAEGEKDKDFDALLKEAGVQDKKTAKPKLDKKELSGEDFKKGMAAITAKAQACYKGTQGSANVKLVIAPSGSVSKVTVSGAFAGKPEADCVSAAVKSASFPAWDGPPQSFGYPILLSE